MCSQCRWVVLTGWSLQANPNPVLPKLGLSGWNFPKRSSVDYSSQTRCWGLLGLCVDWFWAGSCVHLSVNLPFFLLLTPSAWAVSIPALQLLHCPINWVFQDASSCHVWLPTFLSGTFCCSFCFPLHYVSLGQTFPGLSHPSQRMLCVHSEWPDFSVDIHWLLLASVLHRNYFQERHTNLRTLHLWVWPYLLAAFLKTWLGVGF